MGPGAELSKILLTFGIEKTPKCKCKAGAEKMDREGPDWCLDNIETICDWMEESADERGIFFSRTIAKMLVHRAVKKARKTPG